jgi:hypothetical protein
MILLNEVWTRMMNEGLRPRMRTPPSSAIPFGRKQLRLGDIAGTGYLRAWFSRNGSPDAVAWNSGNVVAAATGRQKITLSSSLPEYS